MDGVIDGVRVGVKVGVCVGVIVGVLLGGSVGVTNTISLSLVAIGNCGCGTGVVVVGSITMGSEVAVGTRVTPAATGVSPNVATLTKRGPLLWSSVFGLPLQDVV